MMQNKRMEEITKLALDNGLDPFPVVFEVVEQSTMNNVVAYGLPTRARHWSYGRAYDYQKTYGEMGFSKIYEVILNNNPSYAFMMDTNSEVQNLFITAHCLAHCFVSGTLVETSNGPKAIEQITTRDKVLTHTGQYRNPMALSKRSYSGKMISIKVGSQNIQCTPEHPFLIVRPEKCTTKYRNSICKNSCSYKGQKVCKDKPYQKYNSEWVKAKDIREKDFVLFPKTKSTDFKSHMTISGKKGFGHPGGEKQVCYNLELNEELGEFLGLFVAEGYAREGGQIGLCFHTDETHLHNRSKYLVSKLFNLETYDCVDEDTHSHQILFNEKVLANWLRLNCGSSCYDKHIPFNLSPECSKGFLKGVFHGDGHNNKRAIVLTTTSVKLASQVRKICLDFNIKTNIKIRKSKDRHEAYLIIISGESLTKFANETKISWDVHTGNRNYEYSWFDDKYMYTPVIEVCEFEEEKIDVFNIQVPEDSSYVLFAGAVTHNSDFFKNNCMFKSSDRNMIYHAAEHAGRIESYIEKYGFEDVEHLMDVGFALDDHIDPHKGLHRRAYPGKNVRMHYRKPGEFDDLRRERKKYVVREVINDHFPPHPEKDLLWFLINYAPLEEWEKDILDIIREEAYYFYPQKMTKIMNEGWASYWHAELMYQYNLSPEEHLNFARDHERVVQPDGNPFKINPYFLGYRIFKDIEKRWDEEYGKGAGRKKIFEVREEDDDISFLRNYLTADLVEELNLFTYGYQQEYPEDWDDVKLIEIKERLRDDIVETMVRPLYNGGAPKIVITEIGQEGALILRHDSEELGTLDHNFAKKTLEYVWDLWAAPVELHVKDDDGSNIALCFDEAGAYVKDLDEALSFDDEEEEEEEKKGEPKLVGNRIIIP